MVSCSLYFLLFYFYCIIFIVLFLLFYSYRFVLFRFVLFPIASIYCYFPLSVFPIASICCYFLLFLFPVVCIIPQLLIKKIFFPPLHMILNGISNDEVREITDLLCKFYIDFLLQRLSLQKRPFAETSFCRGFLLQRRPFAVKFKYLL